MLNVSVLILSALTGGVLKGPFRVADHEPTHSQILVRTAMAPDGRFAVAWIDSLATVIPDIPRYELYVRFFDSGGSPTTSALKISKLADTNWIYWPAVDIDSSGNLVLLWVESADRLNPNKKLRFQRFDENGNLLDTTQTAAVGVGGGWWGGDVACNKKGEFVLAWEYGSHIFVRRYSVDCTAQDEGYMVHDSLAEFIFFTPMVGLSDAGDLLATWRDGFETTKNYPRFQGFDSNDDPILPWQPKGYRLDDEGDWYDGSRSEVHWLDNDRFLSFWVQVQYKQVVGRVFSGRGATRHPIKYLVGETSDTLVAAFNYVGQFSSACLSDERFAITYTRCYYDIADGGRFLDHQAGAVGRVQNNELGLTSEVFNYSHPYGADTIWRAAGSFSPQTPAVAASGDRIVWVYSRLNTDTIWEAWATITDWDMGVAVDEKSTITSKPDFEIASPIGREIVVRFWDSPQGFRVTVFDASGRKVDELSSPNQNGILIWGENRTPGVYFIRTDDESSTTHKVVLIK